MILFQSAVQIHEFSVFMSSYCNMSRQISTPAGEEDEEIRYQESCSLKARATSHHCRIGKLA